MVYTPDQPDLFARICGYFDQAGFSILDAKIHTARNGYRLDTFQVVTPHAERALPRTHAHGENDLKLAIEKGGPLPKPGRGRVSQGASRASLWPLGFACSPMKKRSVGCSPYLPVTAWACSMAWHKCWHSTTSMCCLAKISTLGERVEDTFLIDGAQLCNTTKCNWKLRRSCWQRLQA